MSNLPSKRTLNSYTPRPSRKIPEVVTREEEITEKEDPEKTDLLEKIDLEKKDLEENLELKRLKLDTD